MPAAKRAKSLGIASQNAETTPSALIDAGIRLFGDRGYAATSTRDLCNFCGANISAIPYHFGSKEGLYIAVVEHIGMRIRSHMSDSFAPLVESMKLGQPLSDTEAMEALEAQLGAFANLIVANPDSSLWAKLIVREQTSPSSAFDNLYAKHILPMQKMFNFLVASVLCVNPDEDRVKILSHTLIGQILGFVVSKESILRSLGCKEFSPEHEQLIIKTVMENIRASLRREPSNEEDC